jgi:O-methyltransferase involved in polyketide biosynthesis
VWVRHGLSHPELATAEGRVFFGALAPSMRAFRALGRPTLEGMLLARHRIIDALLASAIDAGRVSQVVEVACGMSPRGWRFAERYGDAIAYVEADLPAMAARKRRALERIGSLGDSHRVAEVDALRDDGPGSLAELCSTLDPDAGLAIVTEGLLAYFDTDAVLGMWQRFARAIGGFSDGVYLADLHVGGSAEGVTARAFTLALSAFVRGGVHTHVSGVADAERALRDAGFAEARLQRCDRHPAAAGAARDPAAARTHILEAG